MRELTEKEISAISGGGLAGSLAMGLAGGWAAAVTGFGIGSVIGGPFGGIAGAGGGFILGGAITTAVALASDNDHTQDKNDN